MKKCLVCLEGKSKVESKELIKVLHNYDLEIILLANSNELMELAMSDDVENISFIIFDGNL